jgi:hypothetical protein
MNPYKLYRRSQEIQYQWIREHRVQWLLLNAALIVVFIGATEYWDRREMRKLEEQSETED